MPWSQKSAPQPQEITLGVGNYVENLRIPEGGRFSTSGDTAVLSLSRSNHLPMVLLFII